MRPLWSWPRIWMSVWEGLNELSTAMDTGAEARNPFGCSAGSSKLNISSVIADGRNEDPWQQAVISGPGNSISQLIKVFPNTASKWWIVSSRLFLVWSSSLKKNKEMTAIVHTYNAKSPATITFPEGTRNSVFKPYFWVQWYLSNGKVTATPSLFFFTNQDKQSIPASLEFVTNWNFLWHWTTCNLFISLMQWFSTWWLEAISPWTNTKLQV